MKLDTIKALETNYGKIDGKYTYQITYENPYYNPDKPKDDFKKFYFEGKSLKDCNEKAEEFFKEYIKTRETELSTLEINLKCDSKCKTNCKQSEK